ncbi:MAG: hypothetical protein IJH88_03720 [Eggerthellaceae bacterium]|nr:hypothetical protein [Eggerthellaceae bacterium]
MGKDMLREFVSNGWLDGSVTEAFDPYFEPIWFTEGDWRDDDAWAHERDMQYEDPVALITREVARAKLPQRARGNCLVGQHPTSPLSRVPTSTKSWCLSPRSRT